MQGYLLFRVGRALAPRFPAQCYLLFCVRRWCTCILFSFFCGLKLSTGVGAGRTKRVKPVVV